MKQAVFDFLCRQKPPQHDAMEQLCEAEAERKKLVVEHMFETRDQFKKDLARKLQAKTTLCVDLYRKAGIM